MNIRSVGKSRFLFRRQVVPVGKSRETRTESGRPVMVGQACQVQDTQRGSPERKDTWVDSAVLPTEQLEMRYTMPTSRTLRLVVDKNTIEQPPFYHLSLVSSHLAEKPDLTRKPLHGKSTREQNPYPFWVTVTGFISPQPSPRTRKSYASKQKFMQTIMRKRPLAD
jgi:hypothetical protein